MAKLTNNVNYTPPFGVCKFLLTRPQCTIEGMWNLKRRLHWYALGALFIATVFIWYAVIRSERQGLLTIAVLDVGQGDAIYIEAPNGNQMLIDGGPPKAILSELRAVMPFYDRTIDAILVTNPDKDHIGGFIDVLERYQVGQVIEPGTNSPTGTYTELEKKILNEKAERVIAKRGMKINLGGGASFEILFPDRDISGLDTNTGSIVGRLVYGGTSVMFTGDAPDEIEKYLVSLDGKNLKSDVLKAGHHGSRTSTSPEFVGFVSPSIAIISDGKGNKYGHPHQETLDTLEKFGVKIFRTDLLGAIILKSDGESILVK